MSKAKVVEIKTCDDCPYFDNEYYDYMRTCDKLDRQIQSKDFVSPIPDDCPLPDAESSNDE